MDWNPLIEIGKVIGGVAVAITAIWQLIPRIWGRLTGWMMHEMQEQITKMSEDISYIVSELKTNGGTSLRDAIDRTNTEHVGLYKTLSNIETLVENNVEVQRARMDNDEQMIFLTDAKGNITWVNRSYSRHTGRTINEVKGSGWINVLHPAGREACVEEWYDSVKHNREFERVCDLVDTAGVQFRVDVRSYKMTDSDNKTTGYMGIGEVIGNGSCPWRATCDERYVGAGAEA